MTKDERIEYDEITNYVETSQPDIVAEYIRKLVKKIAELEREVELWRNGELVSQRVAKKSIELMEEFEKNLRHEICEKIRERADKIYAEGSYYVNAYRISSELLDQIEGGK